ncbi:MAG: sigma-70 family RNA polymerase sigma factor [Acidobacteria bacterium]|nr:sigma-70 family RNA polymerase sigma factor [Acidobacteriota bacterium]
MATNLTNLVTVPSVPSNQHLIRRAQQGDAAAFEELYAAHKRRIFNLCLRMIEDWSRAEELMQDTFLQAYRKLNTFRGESAFSTWLHRIAVNVVLMHLRQNRARVNEVPAIAGTGDDDEPWSAYQQAASSDGRLDHAVDRVTLERAISKLPDGYRLVFVLHDVEGYEHHEIAELLGCSIGNTKSQLHKARVKIRHYLRDGVARVRRPRRLVV